METIEAVDPARGSVMPPDWVGSPYELTAEGPRGNEVFESRATIGRTEDRISYQVETSGLKPGNSYTVWVMAFNNPSPCNGAGAPDGFRCGGGDMGNPDAGFALIYGGAFATSGTFELRGERVVGDPAGVELGTPGLTSPDAEIHLRVRDHGPAQAGREENQIGTLMGGCTEDSAPGAGSGVRGTYACRDVQATGI